MKPIAVDVGGKKLSISIPHFKKNGHTVDIVINIKMQQIISKNAYWETQVILLI